MSAFKFPIKGKRLKKLASCDKEMWSDLTRLITPELLRFLIRRGWQPADAEDGVQLTLMKVLERIQDPRFKELYKAYFFSVARDKVRLRKKRILPQGPEGLDDLAIADNDANTTLDECIDMAEPPLTQDQEQVFRLKREGYTFREISRIYGISQPEAQTLFYGAMRKVQRGQLPTHADSK